MILHLYFSRRYAQTFALIAGIFVGLSFLVSLVEQVRRFEGDGASFWRLLGLAILSAPGTLYTLLPLLTVIATLTLFLALARSSELVVARASGRSALVSLAGPLLTAALIGVAAVGLLNPVVAVTLTQYDRLAERTSDGAASALSLTGTGLWLRQGGPGGQVVIRADRADAEGTTLRGASFIGYDDEGAPAYRIDAAEARLSDGAWQLTDLKEWRLTDANPERTATTNDTGALPSTLTPEQIVESFADPAAIPIWSLPGFIDQMDRAGFSARRHRVWLQMELAQPLFLAAMVMVGAAFTMRHTRFGHTGLMVLLALSLGFAVFFIRSFAQILAESGQIPIALAAWGPPLAAILMPLGLLLHWEDG